MKNKFQKGQRVFWNDPDNNLCSGWGIISIVQDDLIGIAKDDGGYVDANPSEVSLNAPVEPREPH